MADYINLYHNLSDYMSDQSARELLGGPSISMISVDGELHYDKEVAPVDPYNPLGLPPFTIRCKFNSGYTPSIGDSQTLVDAGENVWDVTKNDTSWVSLFKDESELLEVICANTSSVTSTASMFNGCTSLRSVPLFDTSSVTNMQMMFSGCTSLTTVALFDTSSVTNMYYTFRNCYAVTGGALALYQQASTQATPPSNHKSTFSGCGANTTTGAAELAQIPTSWGGTMS